MADVLLFPSEPNPADVRLREAGLPAPASHTITAQATVTGTATVAYVVTRAPSGEVVSRGSRPLRFVRPPPPLTRRAYLAVSATGVATVDIAVNHAGRRRREDELVLVGVL